MDRNADDTDDADLRGSARVSNPANLRLMMCRGHDTDVAPLWGGGRWVAFATDVAPLWGGGPMGHFCQRRCMPDMTGLECHAAHHFFIAEALFIP